MNDILDENIQNPLSKNFTMRSLLKFALPTIVMMIFMGLYTIGDTVVISRFVNTDALSALNIVTPVINIIVGRGTMLATGGSAIVARKMGEGNLERASKDFTFIVIAGVTIGVIVAILNMGIAGSALGTGIGYMIPTVIGILFFARSKGTLRFKKPIIDLKVLWESNSNVFSEMVSQIATAVTTFLFNMMMMKQIGENGVAAITIIIYTQFMLTTLYIGFSMGVAPIISYNYGSRNYDRLKNIFRMCMHFVTVISFVVFAIAMSLGSPLVNIFSAKGTMVYQIARQGFLIFPISFLFCGFNIFASATFTALSNGKTSAIISTLRTFVFISIALLLLPQFIGVIGIWLAVPLAEFITVFVAMVLILKNKSKYHYL